MNPNNAISTIMTTEMVTVNPETILPEIKEIYEKYAFHHLPVLDKKEGLVGIISRQDFLNVGYVLSLNTSGKTYTQKTIEHLMAKDIMTKYPMSVEPEDTIGLAADIFLANKFHALPVLDDKELVGIVTTHDLLGYAFAEAVGERKEVELEGRYQ